MITTVEISMYPFQEQYIRAIDGLIDLLEKRAARDDFKIAVQATATLICGEYEVVLKAVQECIATAHEQFGKAVYVTKIIPEYKGV